MIAGQANTEQFAKDLRQRAERLAAARVEQRASAPSNERRWRSAAFLWPLFGKE